MPNPKPNENEKTKILIVDDNPELLEMYGNKFKKDDFLVYTENNGLQALPAANKIEPEIMLVDIMMPNLNGFEVLNVIRKNSTFNPIIIFFSNLSEDQYLKKGLGLEADHFIQKSNHTPSEVVAIVKKVMEEKKGGKGAENGGEYYDYPLI